MATEDINIFPQDGLVNAVGCGKGFLLYEMLLIEPKLKIAGFDISQYAIDNSKKEITRVSRQSYIMVESYRNEKELFNFQCWALTCKTFLNSNN